MRLIWLFLLLISTWDLTAQIKGYIGPKGGGQLSSAYFEHTIFNLEVHTAVIPGYHGGMMAQIFTHQNPGSFLNAGFQTGVSYVSKGWRQTFNDDRTDEPDYYTRMDYLEIPLEAMIYMGKGNAKPFFTLGFFLEHLMAVQKDPDPDLDNLGGSEFYPYEESRDRTFGYGGRGSVGVQHDFGFGAVHLDGFFTFSIRSMMEHRDLDRRRPDLSNHWTVGFSLAYLIPFGNMEF